MREDEAVYVSFDPGPLCGYATFNEYGNELWIGMVQYPGELVPLYDRFDPTKIRRVIWERYRIYKKKALAHVGTNQKDKLIATQCIGSIRSWCTKYDIPYTEQDADILPNAQMWTQVPLPKDHSKSHGIAAFNHGAYWLIDNGLRKTALELAYEAEHQRGEGTR